MLNRYTTPPYVLFTLSFAGITVKVKLICRSQHIGYICRHSISFYNCPNPPKALDLPER